MLWISLAMRSFLPVVLLESQPNAKEIQVERVKFPRYGEARGDYDQVVATLNAADPHGKSLRPAQHQRKARRAGRGRGGPAGPSGGGGPAAFCVRSRWPCRRCSQT